MSASYLVDLNSTCQLDASIAPAAGVSSTPASGTIVGMYIDLINANSYCNLFVTGGPSNSGQCRVAVQTSDATTSGSFTDPTSGLPVFPGGMQSGGFLIYNSGNINQSGDFLAVGFQRPNRYARCIVLSGDQFNAPITAGFVSQLKTTGSGGGFSYSPGSGTVSV